MKALRYILLSCLFLIYVSQPALAVSANLTSNMVCCIDMDTSGDMECCDMGSMDMENCSMDSCNCSIALSISAFTPYLNQNLKFINVYEAHAFPMPSSHIQSPFFTIWTPPDLA